MKRWGIAALAAAGLAVALALVPMRVAVDMAAGDGGLSARDVRGSIWSGQIDGAARGELVLGNLDAGLALLPLFTGRAALDFRQRDLADGTALAGTLYRDLGGGTGVQALSGGIDGGALDSALPISRTSFTDVTVGFDGAGRCLVAHGEVQVSLGASIAGLNLTRGLAGPVSCDGARARVALRGQSDMEQADVAFSSDGQYRVQVVVETGGDVIMGGALRLGGFRSLAPGRYALIRTGQF
ncbi:MAG: hypothetical protein RLZZ58_843 [Pseudomonadota bacterium]